MWSRLFSWILLAGCIWVGVEIYIEGTAGAFGGALSGIGSNESSVKTPTTLERIQGSATGARDRQLSRIERQLGDPSVGVQDHRTQRRED
jgi:hypothetical protein